MAFDEEFEIVSDLSKLNRFTNTKRFNSYRIKTKSGAYYYKQALSEKDAIALNNEVKFAKFVNIYSEALSSPKVIHSEHGLAVFEWIEESTLAPDGSVPKLNTQQINIAVEVLYQLDQLSELGFSGSSPYTTLPEQYLAGFDRSSPRVVEAGLITKTEVEKAKKLIAKHLPNASRAVQHGDLVLPHIFPTSPPTVYDAEHASADLLRFDDFARLYTSAYTLSEEKEPVVELAHAFVKRADLTMDNFIHQSLPTLLYKSGARLLDSLNDLEDIDYRDSAVELFRKVLAQKPFA